MTLLYRFDRFLLNPATRELLDDGELVAMPARALDCLAYLLEHRDRAVGRDELIAAVWGRTEVSDALLSHTIVKIRRTLGDTGNEQRTIRTVPRFGYRWIGELAPLPAPGGPPAPATPAAEAPGEIGESAAPPAPGCTPRPGDPPRPFRAVWCRRRSAISAARRRRCWRRWSAAAARGR